MKISTTVFLLIFSFLFFSCGSTNNTKSQVSLVASEKLSGKVELLYNSDSTKVICIGGKEKFSQVYSFFVYSIKDNQAISKTFNNISDVFWDGPLVVKYKYLSGTVKKDEIESVHKTINFEN